MLELNLMGVPEVVLDGEARTFARRGSVGLLAFLVLSRRAHAREALATLLAGDSSEDQARKYLSNVLVDLRQTLGRYVVATRQTVVFDRSLPHRVDVTEFQSRLSTCLGGESLTALDDAACLYRDEFLAGLTLVGAPDFESWVSAQREELRGQVVQVLQAQVQLSLNQGAWNAGIAPARRLLAQEPWLEEGHRHLMLMLARSGQRQAAIAQYQACKRVLAEELGVEPLPATTALFNRLRAAVTPPRHNLPPVGSPFVGRAAQLQQLVSLLTDADCRLLTIAGLGGSGKTRLAIEVARAFATPATLPPEQPFPDGIIVVSYADAPAPSADANDPSQAAARTIQSGLLSALGLTVAPGADVQQTLVAHLKDCAMLLVLDNLEHLQSGVFSVLEEILRRAPNVRILTTARTPLHLAGERVLHVDGLELPVGSQDLEHAEASALFLQEARRASLGFGLTPQERPQVVELCRLLGGFPLAVILAARWATMLGCTTLLKELARGLDVLSSTEPDLPERHRSIADILDSTLAQLTREERELTHAIALAAPDRGKRGRGSSKTDFPRDLLPRLRPLSEHSLLWVDHALGTLRVHPLLPLHVHGRAERGRVPTRVA
jgi:DNA-binding SARP family transcriptional activator